VKPTKPYFPALVLAVEQLDTVFSLVPVLETLADDGMGY